MTLDCLFKERTIERSIWLSVLDAERRGWDKRRYRRREGVESFVSQLPWEIDILPQARSG